MPKGATDQEVLRLADRIRRSMDTISGKSREQIASQAHTNIYTLSRWANGRETPGGASLRELVKVTGVDGHWLLTGEGSPTRVPMLPESVLEAIRALVGDEVSQATVSDVLDRLRTAQERHSADTNDPD